MRSQQAGERTRAIRNPRKTSEILSVQELRHHGLENWNIPISKNNSSGIEKLQLQIQKSRLGDYFFNLHHHIRPEHSTVEKKHAELEAGLYILVEGKVCFVSANTQDHDKKQYLLSIAKSGIISIGTNECSWEGHMRQAQSFILEDPFTVFQCQHDNCLTIEDSVLIRVDNSLRATTRFDELLSQRKSILQHCHMNGVNNQNMALFSVNPKIFSTFRRYKYYFHNAIQLPSLGIIESGTVEPQSLGALHKKRYYQMHKYAILIPGMLYQVVSTEATVIVIQDNPTLWLKHADLVAASQSVKLRKGGASRLKMRQDEKLTWNSLYLQAESQQTKVVDKWRINKRNKKLAQISRKYQNQLIISMHTCHQGLSFSEKQTKRLKQICDKSKPNVLFDYSKYSPNKSSQTFQASLQRVNSLEKCQKFKKRRQRKTINENMLGRYQNMSKQLYLKFKQSHLHKGKSKNPGDYCLQIGEGF